MLNNPRVFVKEMLTGIPQGSARGPFLFNIYMNDIFYLIEIVDLPFMYTKCYKKHCKSCNICSKEKCRKCNVVFYRKVYANQ